MFCNLHYGYFVNFTYISKWKILHKIYKKTVVETCDNDDINTILVTKVIVELLHKLVEK